MAMETPVPETLTDGSIVLRRLGMQNLQGLFEAAHESIPEISQWMDWCRKDYALEDSRQFLDSRDRLWESKAEFSFGIIEASSGKFLGSVGINQINAIHKMANLGYWVRTSAAKQGIATRATRLTALFATQALGLSRIEIVIRADNAASRRVAEKAGATYEGILRNRLLFHGVPHDAAMYSLTPGDVKP